MDFLQTLSAQDAKENTSGELPPVQAGITFDINTDKPGETEETKRMVHTTPVEQEPDVNCLPKEQVLSQAIEGLREEYKRYAEETDRLRKQNAFLEEMAQEYLAVLNRRDMFKDQMTREIQTIESTLILELDRHRQEMTQYRNSMEKIMYDIRCEFYRGDFRILTSEFQRLWKYVYTELVQKAANDPEGAEKVRENIYEILKRRLDGLRRGLEQAGLATINPQEGDLYNANEHVATNARDVEDDREIPVICTVYPGFKKEGIVICKAGVELDIQGGNRYGEDS